MLGLLISQKQMYIANDCSQTYSLFAEIVCFFLKNFHLSFLGMAAKIILP